MSNFPSISKEQKHYLHLLKRNLRLIQAARILLLLLLLGLWEFTARFGIIDSFIFSSPSQILAKMAEMFQNGSLIGHVTITLTETLLSFFLVTILGIAIAVLLWAFPKFSAILEPYLVGS